MSRLIIDDRGEVNRVALQELIALLKKNEEIIMLSYGGEETLDRIAHLLRSLEFLLSSKEACDTIRRISKPYANRLADSIIRDTLELSEEESITDIDTRRAVVVCLLTKLRQSLGSCFATAPAILLQEEEPLQLFHDLEAILSTGMLHKRVGGQDYTVPLSRTWGNGELSKIFTISLLPEEEGVFVPYDILSSPIFLEALEKNGVEISKQKIKEYILDELRGREKERGDQKSVSFSLDTLIDLIVFHRSGLFLMDRPDPISSEKGQITIKDIDPASQFSSGILSGDEQKKFPLESAKALKRKEEKKERAEKQKRIQEATLLSQKICRTIKMSGECALLKAWEFTMASYAEVQFDLCRWNFYASLGFNWDDQDGIGQILYQISKQTVEETNREVEEIRQKFDAINVEVTFLDQRLRTASTEKELSWIKMEYDSRKTEQYHLQKLADQMAEKTRKITQIHQFLIDEYDPLLKQYFQEVYDADLHDVQVGPYDDSPAGFRLIYKHGRSNSALWTPIHSLDQFIDSLASFFSLTEQDLSLKDEVQGIEREFNLIITRLITHIRSPRFQESALQRTLRAHGEAPIKDAIAHVDSLSKKPWVFTSGGSMSSLVKSYFLLEKEIDEVSRWVENETELVSFLIDTVRLAENRKKYMPGIRRESQKESTSVMVQKITSKSLLMHSPTHAFRLLPEMPLFRKACSSDMYSYSWVFNYLRDPGLQFIKEMLLPQEAIKRAIGDLSSLYPIHLQKRIQEILKTEIAPFSRIFDFVKMAKEVTARDPTLRAYQGIVFESGAIDELVYSHFPYQSYDSTLKIIQEGLSLYNSGNNQMNVDEIFQEARQEVYSAREVKNLFFRALLEKLQVNKKSGNYNVLVEALSYLRSKKALFPEPFIVADSNWTKEYFAFLVSPISCQIEFWTTSFTGTSGRPIPHWKKWLNGTDISRTWGIFVNHQQYQAR